MSDDLLRRLHRRWLETGDILDAAIYDDSCRRAGFTSEPRRKLYAKLLELIGVQARTLSVEIPNSYLAGNGEFRGVAVFHLSIPLFGRLNLETYGADGQPRDYDAYRVGDVIHVVLARDYVERCFKPGDCLTVRLFVGGAVFNTHFYPNKDAYVWSPDAEADDDCEVHL